MRAVLDVLLEVLNLYQLIVIASGIMSWLIAFHVVNMRNDVVRSIAFGLYQLTEPALRPIRRIVPNLGMVDISPVILFFLIMLIERVIVMYAYPYVF